MLRSLDREEKAFYMLRAEAINSRTGHPVEPESEFIIKVQDINDNAPQFINEPYVASIPEMSPIGTVYVLIILDMLYSCMCRTDLTYSSTLNHVHHKTVYRVHIKHIHGGFTSAVCHWTVGRNQFS